MQQFLSDQVYPLIATANSHNGQILPFATPNYNFIQK